MCALPSLHVNDASGSPVSSQRATPIWYFTKDHIDNHSPSRKDGIDRTSESLLRKSYCSFLKDLGMKLRASPVTTATSMMFCHRFYMYQSHVKNDWQTVATACMFLACKVEDNPRPLRDVVVVAYEIIYKWDSSASERIRQRDICYKQKELILDAEHLVLVTIAFDICIQHPFRPLVDALKRLKISNNDVAKAAWNLLNEWLRTTLCLQYKPHYIAAASLSVAAKLLKFKLPSSEGKAWWMEFDVSPKQLEEVTQQMLRYFKNGDKKQGPQICSNAANANPKVEPATCQSTQSCVLSGLTVGSELKEEPAPVDSKVKPPPPHECSLHDATKIHPQMVKQTLEKQSSDCCSGISGVIDNDSPRADATKTIVDDALRKIDVDRLRGAFEKARRVNRATRNDETEAENDMDSDLFIERELEDGVELGQVGLKKRKMVHG